MGIQERRLEQRQALRERILDVSRGIVAQSGFGALSMRKIAEAIDYSPAALYLHFKNRAEIAEALKAEGRAQLAARFAPFLDIADPAARLRALGQAYVDFAMAEPQRYALMFVASSGSDAFSPPVPHVTPTPSITSITPITPIEPFVQAFAALDAFKARDPAICAEAFAAALHGLAASALAAAPDSQRERQALRLAATFDAWLGPVASAVSEPEQKPNPKRAKRTN